MPSSVLAAMLSSSVDVSARVTTFGREDGDAVVQAYLWSVIAPYLLLIEHHISQYPGLHVDVSDNRGWSQLNGCQGAVALTVGLVLRGTILNCVVFIDC